VSQRPRAGHIRAAVSAEIATARERKAQPGCVHTPPTAVERTNDHLAEGVVSRRPSDEGLCEDARNGWH
jgi:hypothetical protein